MIRQFRHWGADCRFLACAALTTLIAVPFGVLTACAIHAGMPPALTRIVKPLIELMAALPSVVIGFIGMIILAPWLQDMFGIATGLNLFNAPSCSPSCACRPSLPFLRMRCAMSPSGLREASLALGATRWETLLKVELRWAMGGIATAVMLGISRVIGETMVVLMVAGGAAIIPESIFDRCAR